MKARSFSSFSGAGHVVYAVGQHLGLASLWHAAHHLGHAAVGQQHELLDELVGVARHLHVGARGMSLLVDLEAHLGAVEADGAVLEAGGAQALGQAVERDELGGIFALGLRAGRQRFGVSARQRQVGLRGLAVALEYLLHLLVGEAAHAAYDGVREVPLLHLALVVEAEDGRVGQFVLVGAERADEVAEAFGEHGYGAVHEVDARGAAAGFAVDGVAFMHVVRHIGDVYAHLPRAVVEAAQRQGVVEVLRVVRVDGEGRHAAEVLAPRHLLLRDVGRELLGGALHALGIFVGQSELREYGVHLGVVVALLSEQVHHLAHRALRVVGPLHDLHHRLVARLAALELVLGYEDVVGQRAAFRHEEAVSALHLQVSDEGVGGALHDLGHFGLAGVAGPAGQHHYAHAVAVEGVERVAFHHEYALSAVVGQEGVAAVALALEGALHYVRAQGAAVVALPVGGEIVVGHEFRQGVEHYHLGGMVRGVRQCEELLDAVALVVARREEVEQHSGYVLLLEAPGGPLLFLGLGHGV